MRTPHGLACRYSCVEDDEFIFRATSVYGGHEILKLRYILPHFHIGKLAGGHQSAGIEAAKTRQLAESRSLVHEHPHDFVWQRTTHHTGSRLDGDRVRLYVDQRAIEPVTSSSGESLSVAIDRMVAEWRRA